MGETKALSSACATLHPRTRVVAVLDRLGHEVSRDIGREIRARVRVVERLEAGQEPGVAGFTQALLAAEVMLDEADGDPGFRRDVADRDTVEAELGEEAQSRAQQPVSAVGHRLFGCGSH